MTTVSMKKGDRLPILRVALKQIDPDHPDAPPSIPLPLSGATVRFRMRVRGGHVLKVDAAATIVDSAAGIVEYAWASGDTDTEGSFNYWFVVTVGGLAETVPSVGFGSLIIGDV